MKGRIAAIVAAGGAAAAAVGAKLALSRRKDRAEAPAQKMVPKAVGESVEATEASAELHVIKGIGAVTEQHLHEIGVTTLAQIAAWSDADIDEIAPRIKVSPERIRREDWVGQARARG